jgi:DNA-binding transcriptional ArsR family regulator
MNASDNANMWQDERVDESATGRTEPDATLSVILGSDHAGSEQAGRAGDVPLVREVDDASTLKALGDPIRLRMLRVLMESGAQVLPVLSVKELAEQLAEPQTKLYRHVKVLETAGLIRVAATRLVSGIVEQRYQAAQHDLVFKGPGLSSSAEAEAMADSVLTVYRQELFASLRASQDATGDVEQSTALVRLMEARLSPEKAAALRKQLADVARELEDSTDDPNGVPVSVMISFYRRPEE